jgi:hypothetical protein
VEFFEDREPEVEVFSSNGSIFGPEKLAALRDKALTSAFGPSDVRRREH